MKVISNSQLQKLRYSPEWTMLSAGVQETVDWAVSNA